MYTLKKSLGQHFLKEESISQKMVDLLQEMSFKNLLEVGPGGGALTKYLLKIPDIQFRAVELDAEKITYLKQQYPELSARIIAGSILDIEPPFEEPFFVVGNFPYNISSQIVFRLIEWRQQISGMLGMFQKEVAARIAAPPGSKIYGVTSVLTQAFFDTEYLFEVPPDAFIPPPKVMSAVIRLKPRTEIPSMQSEASFTRLVKAAFGQRRKTLRNATRGLFADEITNAPLFNQRAEQLSVDDFAALSFQLKP